jgi:hypothetical protein
MVIFKAQIRIRSQVNLVMVPVIQYEIGLQFSVKKISCLYVPFRKHDYNTTEK